MGYMTHPNQTMQELPDRCAPLMRRHNKLLGTVVARNQESDKLYRALTRDGALVHFAHLPDYDQPAPIDLGHHVTLTVDPEDVCLEHPDSLESNDGNCWPARVVLAARRDLRTIVIVKILGQVSTLMSTQRICWLDRAPHAWDRVMVHIPPDAIHVSYRFPGHARLRPRLLKAVSPTTGAHEWNGAPLPPMPDWWLRPDSPTFFKD